MDQIVHAQTPDVRVELGVLRSDGELVVQIATPRGQTIEGASLSLDGAVYRLSPAPEALPITQWFVLDRGIPPSVFEGDFRDTIARIARPVTGEQASGIIWYGLAAQRVGPVDSADELAELLDQYQGLPPASCLAAALDTLSTLNTGNASNPVTGARRVVLIAGAERSVSPECVPSLDLIAALESPVDLIVIDGEIDDVYRDLVEGSGGQMLRAESTSVVARLNELSTAWQRPIFALTGAMRELPATAQGEVTVTLSRGATVTLPVTLQLPASVESAPVSPTESPILEPTITEAVALASAPPPIEPAETSDAAPVGADDTTPAAPTLTATVSSSLAAEFASVALTEAAASPEPLADTAADEPNKGRDGLSLPVIGGTLLLVVIVGAALVAIRQRSSRLISGSAVLEQFEETFIDVEYQRRRDEFFPLPQMSPGQLKALEEDTNGDDLLITQMAEDDEIPQVALAALPPIGWLRIAEDPSAPGIRISAGGLQIGRHPTSDIVIESDRLVSGNHALISQREDGSAWLTVLSKTNPVVINQVALTNGQTYQLISGDVMRLSSETAFEFLAENTGIEQEINPPCTL